MTTLEVNNQKIIPENIKSDLLNKLFLYGINKDNTTFKLDSSIYTIKNENTIQKDNCYLTENEILELYARLCLFDNLKDETKIEILKENEVNKTLLTIKDKKIL